MKLVTYTTNNSAAQLGVLIHDAGIDQDLIIDLTELGKKINQQFPTDMLGMIDAGLPEVNRIAEIISTTHAREVATCTIPLADARLLAPILKPRKNIIGIGLNYTEHVAESARTLDTSKELPQQPVIFSKPPTAVIGTEASILHNKSLTQQLDYEVELAVIISKKGKYIPKDKALDYVFGYTVINDISARDCRRSGQWIVSKGQDTFAPMGPVLVTKDEIKDPHNLNLSLKLNGIEKQNSNTKFMLFNINDLIADLSTVFTLEPGDIIATGTPAGVGAGRNPQEWMWPGDVVEATVEGIGTIRNTIEAAEIPTR